MRNTLWILPAAAVPALALLAFSVSCDKEPECEDICPPDMQRCSDDVLEYCAVGLEGCRVWNQQDCGSSDQICVEETSTTAVCETEDEDTDTDTDDPLECDHKCDNAGDEQCNTDGDVETCVEDDDDCRDWEVSDDCNAAEECVLDDDEATCQFAVPDMSGSYLATCTEDGGESEPQMSTVECPDPNADIFILDWYEVPLSSGDCLWVKGDNLGSEHGADILAFVVAPGGDYYELDDEWACSTEGIYDCPEGMFTIDATKAYIGIGQWPGDSCDPGDMDNYQLFVAINGEDVAPTRVADEVPFPLD